VPYKLVHLLPGHESLESSAPWISAWEDLWGATSPVNTLGTREQALLELALGAQLVLDSTKSNLGRAPILLHAIKFLDHRAGVVNRQELDEAVHGLGCGPLHDDMNWAIHNHLGGLAQGTPDILFRRAVRDLVKWLAPGQRIR
jgi:hypothetical protein